MGTIRDPSNHGTYLLLIFSSVSFLSTEIHILEYGFTCKGMCIADCSMVVVAAVCLHKKEDATNK